MFSDDDIAALFTLAATHKANGEMDLVDEAFLATVAKGVPPGVQVLYLFAVSFGCADAPPTSLEEASHWDVFVLELEGQEGQVMPVPLLKQLEDQLAANLFAVAEFRRRDEGDLGDDDEDENALPCFDGDMGDYDTY
ncbi:MAG: hypothetical protein NUV84_01965 [Candidatus Uhrbacteria bacterium]|nr:hypothetical protein [Candidatus Uhrbacteria bacterium]